MLFSPIKKTLRRIHRNTTYFSQRIAPFITGSVLRNSVYAYWYKKEVNFGDLITPLLLKHFGYTPVYTRPTHAELVATGSILEHIPTDFSGVILGSGFIQRESAAHFSSATVLAVRGELTRLALGGVEAVCGDPGILASRVMPKRRKKRYSLGLVPHYATKNSPLINTLRHSLGHRLLIIDPQTTPLDAFSQIDECEKILSSSLHGLIAADSLGIPTCWFSANAIIGGRFKFDDYYSSIGIQEEPANLSGDETLDCLLTLPSLKPQESIEGCKDRIEILFRQLGSRLKDQIRK